ncbi:MAG: cytochrome P450 [Candidatus Tectomicrobia bacterium]
MAMVINEDIFTPDVVQDPYTYFGQLREEDPVYWNTKYETWFITRYDDLVWLTRHPELFSSAVLQNDPRAPAPAINESDLGLYEYVKDFFGSFFIQHDRPEHADMRKVVHAYFNPKSMELWRPMVQDAIKFLLDEAEEKGWMDVMHDFATPLPLLVIAQMLGMPNQDRKFLRELSEKLLFIGRGEADRMQPLTEGISELQEYLGPLVVERLDNPGDDLLSVLASGEKKGVYTRDQVISNAVLLLLAGHETTINLICNGTLSFIRHPEQWELFKQNPAELMKTATEECLRYDAPVKSITRIASEDVEMRGGKVLQKDERIRWMISSANRDPAKFSQPDTFDINRYPNLHVAFGSGIHHCLGATLARLEGQEAFRALAQRFDALNLETEELAYQPSITFRSLKSMPVTWN